MENKPNLYIFVVDTSGSMVGYEKDVESHIFSEVQKIRNYTTIEQDYIRILTYNDTVKCVQDFTIIQNFKFPLNINYGGNEDIDKLKFYLKYFKRRTSRKFNIKKVYLITDRLGSEILKNGNIYGYFNFVKIVDNKPNVIIKDKIKQTFFDFTRIKINSALVKKLLAGIFLIGFISLTINIKFCSNNNTNINISLETKEKELDIKTQPIINNIMKNTNITIVNVFNQFKIDIKPTINFNFNIDTKIDNQINFHINIPYRDIDSVFDYRYLNKVKNYKLGEYNLQDSLLTAFIRTLLENQELKKYYLSSKNIKLKIVGETDSVNITSEIRYKKPKSLPYIDIHKNVFVEGKEQEITIKRGQPITKNYELGFLRAYFVGEFLKEKVDFFHSKIPKIEYHSKTNCCVKGGKYRTAEIELIIYDVKP